MASKRARQEGERMQRAAAHADEVLGNLDSATPVALKGCLASLKRVRLGDAKTARGVPKARRNKHRISSAGGVQVYKDLESQLYEEIVANFGEADEEWWTPQRAIERFKAICAAHPGHYVNNENPYVWLNRFTSRYGLRLHGGGAFERRCLSKSDAQLAAAVRSCWALWDVRLRYVRSQLEPGQRLVLMNADETFLKFSFGGSDAPTRLLAGQHDPRFARLKANPTSKAGCSCLAFVSSDPLFVVKPVLIFGRYNPSSQLKDAAVQAANGRVHFELKGNSRGKHWMDKPMWKRSLLRIRSEILRHRRPPLVLLMFDGPRCHEIDDGLDAQLENSGVYTFTLPPNITSLVQNLDVQGFFRSVKSRMRSRFWDVDFAPSANDYYEILSEEVVAYSNVASFRKLGFVGARRKTDLSKRLYDFMEQNGGFS